MILHVDQDKSTNWENTEASPKGEPFRTTK